MNKNESDEFLKRSQNNFEIKKKFLDNKDYAGLRSFLDETYGADSLRRHVEECRVLFEEGNGDEALDQILYNLRVGNYNLMHVILASEYSFRLKRLDVAEFLEFSFKSKYEETSSILAAQFVYRYLSGLDFTEEMREAGRLLLLLSDRDLR